jgi:hypothetical protein
MTWIAARRCWHVAHVGGEKRWDPLPSCASMSRAVVGEIVRPRADREAALSIPSARCRYARLGEGAYKTFHAKYGIRPRSSTATWVKRARRPAAAAGSDCLGNFIRSMRP